MAIPSHAPVDEKGRPPVSSVSLILVLDSMVVLSTLSLYLILFSPFSRSVLSSLQKYRGLLDSILYLFSTYAKMRL